VWDHYRVRIRSDTLLLLDGLLDLDGLCVLYLVDIAFQMANDLGWPHSMLASSANNHRQLVELLKQFVFHVGCWKDVSTADRLPGVELGATELGGNHEYRASRPLCHT
jgi:hypothetical protein